MKPIHFITLLGISILSLVQCTSSSTGKKEKNDREREQLSGPVKSTTDTWFEAQLVSGNIVQGKATDICQTFYDEQGYKFRTLCYYEEEMEAEDYKENYYDKKGNKIEVRNFDTNGDLSSITTFRYDKKGNLLESFNSNTNGDLRYRQTYTYDNKGNLLERQSFDSYGNLSDSYRMTYDKQGNIIEGKGYDSNGVLTSKKIYTYDPKGNNIEWSGVNVKDGSILFTWLHASFDNQGNSIETYLIDSNGKKEGKWTSKYDEHGMEIEGTHTDYKDNTSEHVIREYTYDTRGNWIKQIIKVLSHSSIDIIERKIEYYN